MEREARRAGKRSRAADASLLAASSPAVAALLCSSGNSGETEIGEEEIYPPKRRHLGDPNGSTLPGVAGPAPPGIAADVWAALDPESKAEIALKTLAELGMPAPTLTQRPGSGSAHGVEGGGETAASASAGSAGPGYGSEGWECRACTFVNSKPFGVVCEICGTSRSEAASDDHGSFAARGLPQLHPDAAAAAAAPPAAGDMPSQALTVLTWNIWFKELRQGRRMVGMGDVIARVDPDVIGLQEVTPSAIIALRIQPWIKRCGPPLSSSKRECTTHH